VEHVIALVRYSTSLERLQELTTSPLWSVERADIVDQAVFQSVLEKVHPKVIMHLALEPAVFSDMTELETQKHNDAPLETMFECLSGTKESRLIHTGSAWVLGSGVNLAEDAAVDLHSAYARTKWRIDGLLPVLHKKMGVDWINLRIFNVYGKYEAETRLLPYLVSHLQQGKIANLSHGNQVRDFNNVDDVAEAYALALRAKKSTCGQIYHIGTGVGLTVKEFASIVAEVTGNDELIEYGSTKSPDQQLTELTANPALAQKKLGWSPPSRPDERIKQAARWWLEYNVRS
jgi:dolichol-phosphate mannosyltransferase